MDYKSFGGDFYPSPNSLIEKLIEGIKIEEITTLIEPSCGSGNIVDYIVDKANNLRTYKNIKLDIDCIEIDENLRRILKGKNHRVIHDNFLTFHTLKNYSHIIANFPFSEGDKHLKKALDMLETSGGILRCVVNAETIKNPYSNIRKEIINILNRNNATIEFLQEEFTQAERKTDVEVALIKCKIDKKEVGSLLLENLKQAEIEKENTYENKYVSTNDFIQAIIKQYEFECNAGVKLIEEYNKLKAFTSSEFNKESSILSLRICDDRSYGDPSENNLKNDYLKKVRRKYWSALFNNPNFTKLFTSNLQRDFYNKLDELSDYDFNEFNIKELKNQLNQQVAVGVRETILTLFDDLSHKHYWDKNSNQNIHYYSGWATNSCWKVNKRIVSPLNAFDDWDNRFNPTKYTCIDKLLDIEKIFNYLDSGRSEEVDLREVLKKAEEEGQTKNIMTKFFKINFFKRGTAHLTFLDEELLKKFNVFGAMNKENWLPPSYGKKKYSDMTNEEKAVIDEFEGEEEYRKTMSDPKYYIYDSNQILMLK